MIFSHIYADDTKDRKTWNNWNSVNSALFPFPEPTAVIISCWVASKKPVALVFARPLQLFTCFVNIPKLFADSGCIDCGIKVFISAFLSSVSPSYLWIRHAFWDLPYLQDFHPEISPRNFGQHFPVGFQDVGWTFSHRFSGCKILNTCLSSWGTL